MGKTTPRKILVTGGAGFIGSNLVDALVERGDRVVVLDNFDDFYDLAVKHGNLESALASGSVELVEGDIRDAELVRKVMGKLGPEVVYHLAAKVGVRSSVEDPLSYEEVNVRGAMNVFRGAAQARAGVVVFASSSSVYGTTRAPFREDDPAVGPLSPYAASKRSAELFAHAFCHLGRMPIVATRLFTVYGPRQRPDLAIHKFTRQMLAGEAITRFGDGSSARDYTYVTDIVDGLLRAASLREGFQIVNLGGGQKVSLNRLLALLEKELGVQAKIRTCPERPEDMELTWAEVGKARERLGWSSKMTFENGIVEFVRWYRSRNG